MAKIVSAYLEATDMISIQLSGGNIIMLHTEIIACMETPLPRLVTDYESLYLPDGQKLTLTEIFERLLPASIVNLLDIGIDSIAVELSNGSIVVLDIEGLLQHHTFATLREDDRIRYPHIENGDKAIFWRGGPRMTLAEMVLLLENEERKGE